MRQKHISVLARIASARPDLSAVDAKALIAARRIRVGGVIVLNERSQVRADAHVAVDDGPQQLRGTVKLRGALAMFDARVANATALDVGASTGGFTQCLLDAGARKVYAVDAGYGQLHARLRGDARVINLERTNLGTLTRALVPEPIDVVTMDLSYLAIANAIGQLAHLQFVPAARLLALVKPMFELALATAPLDDASLAWAIERASAGIERHGWRVVEARESSVRGARGAREGFVFAHRVGTPSTRPT